MAVQLHSERVAFSRAIPPQAPRTHFVQGRNGYSYEGFLTATYQQPLVSPAQRPCDLSCIALSNLQNHGSFSSKALHSSGVSRVWQAWHVPWAPL